jgi:hypothetical protein
MAARASLETKPRWNFVQRGFVFLFVFFSSPLQPAFAIDGIPSRPLDSFLNFAKSLSCLAPSIILVAPKRGRVSVRSTGFICLRATKSSPQMKQNPWFERFTELDQNKNVPLGQNLEG